jgi:hypothetical protein
VLIVLFGIYEIAKVFQTEAHLAFGVSWRRANG